MTDSTLSMLPGERHAQEEEITSLANAVSVRGLTHTYSSAGQMFTALDNVDFSAKAGEFVTIVGPSGCGKSTLLFLIAGIHASQSGVIEVLGQPVTGPGNRDTGFVFQKDALLPWKTALENVALPLKFRGMSTKAAQKEARDWLHRVNLKGFEDHYPSQLSGGMRKRVAIASSLVYQPKVLMMDEPFSALDAQTRNFMQNDLLKIWEETRQTVIYITHDLEEAVGLSDRVVTMSATPGRILTERVVPLPRPRNLLEIRFDPAFVEMHEQLWQDLREQVLRSGFGADT